MASDSKPLRRALALNAFFSAFSAIAMLVAGGWVAHQLGLASATPVYVMATVLLLFAFQLGRIARSGKIQPMRIMTFIASDVVWVIASIVLVALFYDSLTMAGLVLVDVVAIAVSFFAVLQFRGLRAFQRGAS